MFHYLHPLFLLPEGGEKAKNIFNNSDTFQPLLRQLFSRQILWISATVEEDPEPLAAASMICRRPKSLFLGYSGSLYLTSRILYVFCEGQRGSYGQNIEGAAPSGAMLTALKGTGQKTVGFQVKHRYLESYCFLPKFTFWANTGTNPGTIHFSDFSVLLCWRLRIWRKILPQSLRNLSLFTIFSTHAQLDKNIVNLQNGTKTKVSWAKTAP